MTRKYERSLAKTWLRNTGLVLLYAVSGWLGLQLAIPPGYATAVFPASGISIAFVLLYGWRVLPGVFLGSLLLNTLRILSADGDVGRTDMLVAVGIAASSSLQALAAWWLLRKRIVFPNDLVDERDLRRLLILGGPVACVTAATLAQFVLLGAGAVSLADLPWSWFTWWAGDSIGVVIFAPLTILLLQPSSARSRGRIFSVVVPVVVALIATVLVFLRFSSVEVERLRVLSQITGSVQLESLLAWNILALGLVLTSLLGAFLLVVTGRKALVAREVKQRTAELHQANVALEDSLQTQARFLAMMSHEIRTPLHTIVGYLERVENMKQEPAAKQYLRQARVSSLDLRRIVDDILEISRSESAGYEIRHEAFSVGELVDFLEASFAPVAADAGLQLCVELQGGPLPTLHGDALRIRQIVGNLLSNAVKYTPQGGVTLEFAAHKVSGDCWHCCWTVRDTGPGIEAAQSDRIFEPFTRAADPEEIAVEGVGLGLNIARRLAQAMGGTLELVDSEAGGACFRFAVELQEGDADAEIPAASVEPSGSESLRVLVAEDNPVNQQLLQLLLTDMGHVCTLVSNGQQALDAVATQDFDVVLMDMQMPVMNGLEATQRIRENHGDTPTIVGLTANAFEEDRRACKDAGMQRFLAKPFEAKELENILKTVHTENGAHGRRERP